MRWDYESAVEYVIAALNRDVRREVRIADDCIQRARSLAQPYSRFRQQIARCAASALSNASALAAEVRALGGVPPSSLRPRRGKTWRSISMEEYLVQAQTLLAHYQGRLAMADRFGLARLKEVFQDIVASKRSHLKHAALIAAAGMSPRQLG